MSALADRVAAYPGAPGAVERTRSVPHKGSKGTARASGGQLDDVKGALTVQCVRQVPEGARLGSTRASARSRRRAGSSGGKRLGAKGVRSTCRAAPSRISSLIASPVAGALSMPQTLWPVATKAPSTPGTAPMRGGRLR
jgi:hypothetical protein